MSLLHYHLFSFIGAPKLLQAAFFEFSEYFDLNPYKKRLLGAYAGSLQLTFPNCQNPFLHAQICFSCNKFWALFSHL